MRCAIVPGNTSLCVAKLWTHPTHIHLAKYVKLSRTPSQWYGARGNSNGTSPSYPRNSNNLCPLSLSFNFPSGPIATSLVDQSAGASILQCRSSLVLISSVASWRRITRARYHSSPRFAGNTNRISISQKVSSSGDYRSREPPYASFSTEELGFNNMSGRKLRVRKSSTKTVETSSIEVHVVENGAESTMQGPKPRSTPKKEVKKLNKDDFEIDSWQYQLLERHEDNNLTTYTTVELRELLREMKKTSKSQKANMLKVVKKWLKDNGCDTPSVLDEDQSSGNEEKSLESMDTKAANTSSNTKVETTTPGRGKRKRQAPSEEIDVVEAEAGADKPLPKAKSTKKGSKPSTPKESESKDAVLQTGTLTDESKEAWTLLVHKKPQPEWVAYNPATMRPELPSSNEKVVKIISWNVNGLRALLKEKGMSQEQGSLIARLAAREDFDVLCLQETKLQEKDVDQIRESLLASHESSLWSCSTSKLGYSGTAVISRIKPLSVQYGLGIADHDLEGRLITCEFDSFYLVVSYVPNAGAKLERLEYRTQNWDPALSKFMKELEKTKPVILTGDLNVANEEIDIHHPAGNTKSAGFTEEERTLFKTNFLEQGFVDTFRKQHPNAVSYTYWGYRTAARPKNQGWRLDYFLLSESLADSVHDSYTIPDVGGSDHCPIGLILKV